MSYSRDWDDGSTADQTLYGTGTPSQSVVSQKLRLATAAGGIAWIKFDLAPAVANFDTTFTLYGMTSGSADTGFLYRTSSAAFAMADGNAAYMIDTTNTLLYLYKGTNGGGATWTSIKSTSYTFTAGTAYTVRVRVMDSFHEIWVNGVQILSCHDNSFMSSGLFGLRTNRASAGYNEYDNLVITDLDTYTGNNRGTIGQYPKTLDSPSTDTYKKGMIAQYPKLLSNQRIFYTPSNFSAKAITSAKVTYSPLTIQGKKSITSSKHMLAMWTDPSNTTYITTDTTGYISGSVKIGTTPVPNTPVRLYYKRNGKFIQGVLTDDNGVFRFNYLEVGMPYYTVIAYIPTYNPLNMDSFLPKKVIV